VKERVTQVHTRPSLRMIIWRRGAIPLGVLAAAALVAGNAGGVAGAAPAPTVAQVQHRLSRLDSQAGKLDQQYDQVQQELTSASQRLGLVQRETGRYLARFRYLRSQVGQIAAAAYEEGSLSSPAALLTSSNPQQILNQSSILLELSSDNSAEMNEFISAARQLSNAQQAAQRARDAIVALREKLAGQKKSLGKLITQQKALLAQLTPTQQAGLGGGTGLGGGYHGPTTTQADKAVAFAYDQLGCPYVFGGIGPCPDGFDCSGLTMQAWAAAGVSIPRTSEEQWADLPHVPTSDLQPGDILVFAGASHVGIYVGDGDLIDAPQTGQDVQKVALSGWFAENLDGAVQP
jgi:peptidoglycan DL-endopeptidase CwlO